MLCALLSVPFFTFLICIKFSSQILNLKILLYTYYNLIKVFFFLSFFLFFFNFILFKNELCFIFIFHIIFIYFFNIFLRFFFQNLRKIRREISSNYPKEEKKFYSYYYYYYLKSMSKCGCYQSQPKYEVLKILLISSVLIENRTDISSLTSFLFSI